MTIGYQASFLRWIRPAGGLGPASRSAMIEASARPIHSSHSVRSFQDVVAR
jgi:hypothetical protein